MEQYINKQEVLDEIVNLDVVNCLEAPTISHNEDYKCGYSHALETVRVFLGTLEGKEVDLEKEFNSFLDDVEGMPRMWHSDEQIEWGKDIAKHFFNLGIQVLKLTWQDIKDIAEIGNDFMNSEESDDLTEEEYYTEILKRFLEKKNKL